MDKMEIINGYKTQVEQASGDKYKHSGIYEIFIDDVLVYVGRSADMLTRIANHMYLIDTNKKTNKYVQLYRAKRAGRRIRFDVLEYCSEEDTKIREAYWINTLRPWLNVQIPKMDNPQSFWYNKDAKVIRYEQILLAQTH